MRYGTSRPSPGSLWIERVICALKAERLQVEHVTEQRELGVCAAERFFERGRRRAVVSHRSQTMPCAPREVKQKVGAAV